ncbi:MAG: DivIVA domain-containing protein [Actinomycetota bacterium]|nr:DivIVA domain-containing protein [Actinomycetota bacterium]
MEVTGKVLREVEFRDRLRGYDTDEVDEFLEKVAVGVDALNARIEELEVRLAAKPKEAPEPLAAVAPAPAPVTMDDDAIRRTLVLAQRTADLAVSEARDEASRLVEEAKAEADGLVARADEAAQRLRAEVDAEVQERLTRLGEERERLERDVRALARVVAEERERLTESLTSALRFVRDTLSIGDEAAARTDEPSSGGAAPVAPRWSASGEATGRPAGRAEESGAGATVEVPGAPVVAQAPAPELPDVEAEIDEDAASAAWSPRTEHGRGHVGRPRPMSTTSGEHRDAGEDEAGEGEEALWERWAAGRDLGVVPGPGDFGRRAANGRPERDRGWSA